MRLSTPLFIGCFSIDRSTLQNQLLPIPTAALNALHDIVPSIFGTLTNNLLEELMNRMNTLRTAPISLDTCTTWISVLQEVLDSMEERQERHQYIIDMHKVMISCDVII